MNIGKECSSAECARLRSRLHFRLRLTSARQVVTTRRVASTRQGVRSAPPFDFRHCPASCASPREIMPAVKASHCLRRISRGEPCEIMPAVKASHCLRRISRGEPCEIMPRAKASHCLRRISQGEPRAPLPQRHSRPIPRSLENSPAIHGWDSRPANFQSPVRDERTVLPSLAGLFHLVDAGPSHKWLGYCRCVAPRLCALASLR
jgi:hypothetical protein